MTPKTLLLYGGIPVVMLYAILQIYLMVNTDGGDNLGSITPDTMTNSTGVVPSYEKPIPVSPIVFTNAAGETLDISAWRGKVVLLNIWATWCVPCREEMPTLDRLQQQLGGKHFEVAALSIDNGGMPVIQKFYDQIGIEHLQIYVDQSMQASTRLGIYGIPATLLLSPEGKEIGRLIGPTTWDSPEMIAFLETTITQQFTEK